jgi:hypothetical protein
MVGKVQHRALDERRQWVQNAMSESHDCKSEQWISLRQLATRMRLNPSQVRKYVLFHLKMKPYQARTPDSRGKKTYVFTQGEADQIIERRNTEFPNTYAPTGAECLEGASGFLYIVLLCPELSMYRVKLGFAVDVQQRLRQHQTAAPTARLVKSWRCRPTWEIVAIDSLTRTECSLVREEVFECETLEALIDRGDAFFGLLPRPDDGVPLSQHSPFHTMPGGQPPTSDVEH